MFDNLKLQKGLAPIIIVLIIVGILALAGGGFYVWQKSTKPSISLLSPNGGEIWTIGSKHTIRWATQNIPLTDKISIHIRRVPPPPLPTEGQEFDPIIFIDLENDGSEDWTISDMYPVGNYLIEVNSYPSLPITNVVSDESDASFRIESSSDETADWKTYRNKEYGFELKYPKNWNITEMKPASDEDFLSKIYMFEAAGLFANEIQIFENKNALDDTSQLRDFIMQWYGLNVWPAQFPLSESKIKEFKIDNQSAIQIDYIEKGEHPAADTPAILLFSLTKQYFYRLGCIGKGNNCHQILSTFKFEEERPEPTCQNKCSQAGLKRCSDNNYQICGNYDVDTCLEWGPIIPCSGGKICKDNNCVLEKTDLLLIVENSLYEGLIEELNTYSDDVKGEFGFETIIKTFSSSASVFELKSYIKQIYNNHKLNGILLIGDLPTGKFYHPGGYYSKDDLPLYDYIYQDIYDACEYSKEWGAFNLTSPGCENNQIPPFWISRLTPNFSSKDSLLLLKNYFKRNHEYRIEQYKYEQKILLYIPILLESNLEYRKQQQESLKRSLREFNVYIEGSYSIIDPEKENSDQLFLNEIKKPYKYENLIFNGHGAPTWHHKNIFAGDIANSSFFFGQFVSCSVGRFTTKDYIVGKYLFEGKSLVAAAPSVPVMGAVGSVDAELHYLLSLGEPLFESIKVSRSGPGAVNFFGDLTLTMRYIKKPSIHQPLDPIIALTPSYLYFSNQPEIELKVKNLGKSVLGFKMYPRYYKFKEGWVPTFGAGTEVYVEFNEHGHYLLNPGDEVTFKIESPQGAPAGTYKGEMYIFSNDPVNPYISVPFEAIVK